jgi:hypothetical protein
MAAPVSLVAALGMDTQLVGAKVLVIVGGGLETFHGARDYVVSGYAETVRRRHRAKVESNEVMPAMGVLCREAETKK